MTDRTDPPASDPRQEGAEPGDERLDDLATETDRIREAAEDDLEPGGARRTFADHGVRRQVEEQGDTEHPPADR